MAHHPSRLDLVLELLDRRSGLVDHAKTSPLRSAPSFWDGVEQILERDVQTLLGHRERLKQPIAPGAKLLNLGPTGLPLTSKVGQHPLPNDLGLVHHLTPALPAVLDDFFSPTGSIGEHFLACCDRLDHLLLDVALGIGSQLFAITLGPLDPLGRRCVRRLEHGGRL